MKKKFLGLAVLVLSTALMTSCSKGSVETNKDRHNRISFDVATGKQTTKASEQTNANWEEGAKINVHAFATTTGALFHEFNLTFGGGAWGYGAEIFQPGYTLTYYAYSPIGNVASFAREAGIDGDATFDYTVQGTTPDPDDVEQEDLMVATVTTKDPGVLLPFKHILSQINFAVQGIPNVIIDITGITVNDVYGQGTYTYTVDTFGSWDVTGSTSDQNYEYTPVAGRLPVENETGIVYLGNGGDVHTYDNALMLLPQEFAAGSGGYFSFNYKITEMDGTTVLFEESSVEIYFEDLTPTIWEMGKRYVYVIDFSTKILGGEITFTVDVDDWINYDDKLGNVGVVIPK